MQDPGRRLLIIGCGYTGRRVAVHFQTLGWAISGTSRSAEGVSRLRDLGIEGIPFDLTRAETLDALPSADAVLVCPAPDSASDNAYQFLYDRGLANLADLFARRPPRRLIYTSSIGVWNVCDGRWLDESSPVDPATPRQRALLAGEEVMRQPGLSGMVIRLAGIYGPGRHRFLESRDSKRPVDGADNFANTIHVDDVARIVAFLIDHGTPGDIYVGVDQRPMPRREMLTAIAHGIGFSPPQFASNETGRNAQNKRCSSRKLSDAGFRFLYPDSARGYQQIVAEEEGGLWRSLQ